MVLGPQRPTEYDPIVHQHELDARVPFFGTFQNGRRRVWSNLVKSVKFHHFAKNGRRSMYEGSMERQCRLQCESEVREE